MVALRSPLVPDHPGARYLYPALTLTKLVVYVLEFDNDSGFSVLLLLNINLPAKLNNSNVGAEEVSLDGWVTVYVMLL